MFNQLRGWEWLIIIALILLLFGAKRLPDAARGLGRSLRIFKAETKGLAGDGKGADGSAEAATPAIDQGAPPAPAPASQAPASGETKPTEA
jgi:sec-independent protein translocase protein TatA